MRRNFSLLAFAGALILAFACYSASFTSDFQLDDVANLSGLAEVSDQASAQKFVLSGIAGPVGRPLSMLSFALQADQWQEGAAAFLFVNVLIHLLNAALLAWSVRQVFLFRGESDRNAVLVGCAVASVWVLLPLISTTSMLVVQRMTSLSALFLLLGLATYLYARARLGENPRRGLLLMGLVLFCFTALATLAKESGVLLPLFVLVLESTLLNRPRNTTRVEWNLWSGIVLWFPSLLVVAFLLTNLSYPDHMIARRGFNAGERLLTEAHILWIYLSKALFGLPGGLGVYQGDIEIARSLLSPATFVAVVSWIGGAVAAIVWRRRFPLAAFALLWFLAGHLLESTVFPLELYFEHRNYLPVIGPILGLTAFLLLHSERTQRIARLVIPLVLIINAWFLYGFASLQGDSSFAARYWVLKYPDSARAATNLAQYQLDEEGPLAALQTLVEFSERHPEHGYFGIIELNVLCTTEPERVQVSHVDAVRKRLGSVAFTFTALQMLEQLFATSTAGNCAAVRPETVIELAAALLANPLYVDNPQYRQTHHVLMALIQRHLNNRNQALQHLEMALDSLPSIDLLTMMTITLVEGGESARARRLLQDAESDLPGNPLHAFRWRQRLVELESYLDAVDEQGVAVP